MLKGSVVVYLLPLLGMIIFAVLADSLIAADAAARDLLVIIAAISGFAFMVQLSRRFLSSQSIGRELTPVVIRKNIAST